MRLLTRISGCEASSMLRVAAIFSIAIAAHGVALAQDAKPDTVEVHGKALMLSCAEWRRNQDGSWANTAPLLVGEETVKQVTLRGAKETNVLETKCGSGSSRAAVPAPSDDSKKHARHRRHSAESSDGA